VDAAAWIAIVGLIVNVIFVIVLVPIRTAIKDLTAADAQQIADINSLRVLVSGDYLKRDEFQSSMAATRNEQRENLRDQTTLIESLFARLEKKVDAKVDK
jgi:hypothetical protein